MKKILSIILGIFISVFLGGLGNMLFAQGATSVGVNIDKRECLMGMGQDCFDYETLIGIDKQQPDYTATSVAQDVIFAATYMVGAVLMIVIIYCGLRYIFASAEGKDTKNYSNGLKYAAIGAILVRGAYGIVRLIQYIARG